MEGESNTRYLINKYQPQESTDFIDLTEGTSIEFE